MFKNIKALGPVVATALLIVVAVGAIVGFQTFFNNYSSSLFSKVETNSVSNSPKTQVETIVGESMYFNNGVMNNITITQVKIDGIDCNISGVYENGISELNISSCISNITTQTPEVVIYTQNGIFSKSIFIKTPITIQDLSSGSNSTNSTGNLSGFPVEIWNVTYDSQILARTNAESYAVVIDSNGNFFVTGYFNDDTNDNYYTIKYDSSGNQIWTKNFTNGLDKEAYAIAVDGSDNIIITGYSDSGVSDDFYTIKYDNDGVKLWNESFDVGGFWDEAHGVAVDSNDDVIVVGFGYDGSTQNYHTIKYNGTTGDLIWNVSYDSGNSDYAYAVAIDSVDNIYVTGKNNDGMTDNIYTIKYNGSDGSEIWNKTIDTGNTEIAFSIDIYDLNNMYLTGESSDGITENFILLKFNSSTGDEIWNVSYDSGNTDRANAVAVDNSNNIYVTGRNNDGSTNNFYTVKYNSSGDEIWSDVFDALDNDEAYDVAVDSLNEVLYVTGSSRDSAYMFYTMKYNLTDGSEIFNRNYSPVVPTSLSDTAYGIVKDSLENIYITGFINGGTTDDILTVKYDSDGNLIWNRTYDGGNADTAYAINSDVLDNIYVAGVSSDGITNNDFVIKYDSEGNLIWNLSYDSGLDEYSQDLKIDSNLNIYLFSTKSNGADNDFFIKKYNGSNVSQILWNATYDAGATDEANEIELDSSFNAYVLGNSYFGGNTDYYLIKYNGINGSEEWSKRTDRGGSDNTGAMAIDSSDNIYVVGQSYNITSLVSEYLFIKYDSSGNQIWNKTNPLYWDHQINSMDLDINSSIYVTGNAQTVYGGNTFGDYYTVKFNSTGSPIWNITYNSTDWDNSNGIVVDSVGNIYITGGSSIGGSDSYYTIKYQQQ